MMTYLNDAYICHQTVARRPSTCHEIEPYLGDILLCLFVKIEENINTDYKEHVEY